MILTESKNDSIIKFKELLSSTILELNQIANNNKLFFANKDGIKLEKEVYQAINFKSKNTLFENKIELISGLKFPDIIINKNYGIEVKSSKSDNWQSLGNSVLESNRVDNISHLFLLFGKLSNPIEFICKPYEECLSDISVTHSPRYQINMKLSKNETIFSKMGISYEQFRNQNYPIEIFKEYYRERLKENEYLWWLDQDQASPLRLQFINALPNNERKRYCLEGLILFPEMFSNNINKFNNFTLYLLENYGLVSHNLRDLFTAGGKYDYFSKNNKISHLRIPKIFKLITDNKELFKTIFYGFMKNKRNNNLFIYKSKIGWINIASNYAKNIYNRAKELFIDVFS